MALEDLRELLDEPTLTLPIGGKKYVVKEASGERYLRIQRLGAALDTSPTADKDVAAEFNRLSEVDFGRLALGDVFDQLIKADVTGSQIERATMAAFFWHIGQSAETVAAAWQGKGLAGPSSPPRKAARTTRGAAATTTRRRASGSGGKSPQK